MAATYMKKIKHSKLCVTGVYSSDITKQTKNTYHRNREFSNCKIDVCFCSHFVKIITALALKMWPSTFCKALAAFVDEVNFCRRVAVKLLYGSAVFCAKESST